MMIKIKVLIFSSHNPADHVPLPLVCTHPTLETIALTVGKQRYDLTPCICTKDLYQKYKYVFLSSNFFQ